MAKPDHIAVFLALSNRWSYCLMIRFFGKSSGSQNLVGEDERKGYREQPRLAVSPQLHHVDRL